MKMWKTFVCLVLVFLLAFMFVAPEALAASRDDNSGGNNSGNNNNDGRRGTDRAAQDLLFLLVLFTGPQNWDYVGVMGVYEANEVSTEQSSSEDIF